jgi:hypothetical protein
MTDPGRPNQKPIDRIVDKATEIVTQAVAVAGPALQQAREKAGPALHQAREKAGPALQQAREKAAPALQHGVETLATNLDKATGGKYSDRISAVTSKLRERQPDVATPATTTAPNPDLVQEPDPLRAETAPLQPDALHTDEPLITGEPPLYPGETPGQPS